MPLEWPSMRSMARWVLPVLVGPRIATMRRAGSKTPMPSESVFAWGKASRGVGLYRRVGGNWFHPGNPRCPGRARRSAIEHLAQAHRQLGAVIGLGDRGEFIGAHRGRVRLIGRIARGQ